MNSAQMIARAWLDDTYRTSLIAQGMDVPPRPQDLVDDQLDLLSDAAGERFEAATPCSPTTCQ